MKYTREDYLEVLLQQAQSTIEFLHGCLTEPHVEGISGGYTYGDPEMTLKRLAQFEKAVGRPQWCLHSRTHTDCEACQAGARAREIRAQFEV